MFVEMRNCDTIQKYFQLPGKLWASLVFGVIIMSFVILPMYYPVLGQLGMGVHGRKIYQEMDIELTRESLSGYLSCAPLSEDRFGFIWVQSDFDGVRRAHLQIVSDDQQLTFPDNPPALSLNNHCIRAEICRAPIGGAYIGWAEIIGDERWRIMLQRVFDNGSPVWRRGGIEVIELTGRYPPGYRIHLSSEGNCFVEIMDPSHIDGDIVFAFDRHGRLLDGWPFRGYGFYNLIPDNEGGFWFQISNGINENRNYRVGNDGRIVDGYPLILESPEDGYRDIGFQVSDDHIFSFWTAEVDQPTIVGVYDFSGELQRFDNLIAGYNDERADFISMSHHVMPDNRIVVVYNHIDHYQHRYGNGHHFYDPLYAPRIICYAPFEENRFPFGRDELISIGNRDSWGKYYQIDLVGGNYFIGNNAFDPDGQRIWGGYPALNGGLYPIDDKAWVFGGNDWGWSCQPFFAYQINDRALRENEAEIVDLVPNQRVRGRTWVFPTANGGCDILMMDNYRGLIGQHIDAEGFLSSSLAARTLEPLCVNSYYNKYSSGSFANSHWVAIRVGGRRDINLVVLDNDGSVQSSVSHDFSQEGNRMTDYTSPVGNGRDRLVSVFRNGENDRIRLVEFNQSGEIIRTVERDLELPRLFDYWPGQGWLYLDRIPDSDYWRANLIDDDLNIRWRREINYRGGDDRQNKPDHVAFYDTTATVYWFDRRSRMIRAEIGASSTPLRSDSLYFFSDDNADRSSIGKLRIASDGGWWAMVEGSGRLQKITYDGNKVFGDSGLVLVNSILHFRLLPDNEGGVWTIWRRRNESRIRAIHFNAAGEKVSDNYPDDGLDIFNNDRMGLESAAFDPNTGNVWVLAERSEYLHHDVASRDLWIQIVGENVVNAPGVDPARAYSFALSPAYPNPFNAATVIPFSLPDRGFASLQVYDLKGRLVQDISPPDIFNPGLHKIVWNARTLSTGVYFIRLESEGKIAVRRAYLAK